MSSVHHTSETLGIWRLVVSPGRKARFAQQKFPATVMKFLSVLFIIHRVAWETILPFRSTCWGSECLPTNRLKLPPNLVEESSSKVALSDSDDVGLVVPKGKLRKVGQGLRITDCDIDQVDGNTGGITPVAGW